MLRCCDCGKEFRISRWVYEAIVEVEGPGTDWWCYDCSDPPPRREADYPWRRSRKGG